jgi:CheY-like chemotaxis protein
VGGARRPTVLVVEDEAPIRDMLQEVLDLAGYAVEVVSEGRLALQRAHEILPDLVLSDLMLPGLSGRMLASQLQAAPRTAQIPIVLISAAYQPQPEDCFAAVLDKPFDLDTLLQTLERLLD